MTNPNKGNKQLSKVLAILTTLVSVMSITAVPSVAVDSDWSVEVFVSNDDPCVGQIDGALSESTAATWSPDPDLTYTSGQTRTVFRGAATVPVAVTLGWQDGELSDCQGGATTSSVVRHTGTIQSSFTSNDGLAFDAATCFSSPCSAPDNYQYDQSQVSGSITIPSSATVGRKTGTFTVTWTP